MTSLERELGSDGRHCDTFCSRRLPAWAVCRPSHRCNKDRSESGGNLAQHFATEVGGSSEAERPSMRVFYSYARLFFASWLFMGGLAIQFLPSAAAVARDARWRERQLQTVPADQHAQWVEERDAEDASTQAYLRV